jgi:serine/threonine-protein kinase ATR
MVRRQPAVNGTYPNGDAPPPSTLAAQIVQNQTTAIPQQNGDTPTFSELLQEILSNHTATPETDLQVNVKLVSVVAQAGLGPLIDGNPFAETDQLLEQAKDSLTVIESTVKRQPEVLFTITGTNGPQLLLPLLSRLMAVCGRQRCDDLPVVRLVDSTFSALSASIDLWQHAQTLHQVIESCVNDILDALEHVYGSSNLSVKLPPARSVAQLWSHSESSIALPHGCQTSIIDSVHAYMLALEMSTVSQLSGAWKHEVEIRLQRLFPGLRDKLEHRDQLLLAFERLLSMKTNIPVLEYIFTELCKDLPSAQLQRQIATSLMEAISTNCNAVADYLMDPLLAFSRCDAFDRAHEDLQIAITTAICRCTDSMHWPYRVQVLHTALKEDNVMSDSSLWATFQQLNTSEPLTCTGRKRQKRRKITDANLDNISSGITARVAKILIDDEKAEDLTRLSYAAARAYEQMGQEEQCIAWQALTDLARVNAEVALNTVSEIIELPEAYQAKRPRILSILAMHACVSASAEAKFIDLRDSAFGQLCLRSIHSSVRELRMAAAQCLPAFLREDLPKSIRTANRKVALEYLRVLSDRNVPSEQETLISAWGGVAAVCDASELNLVLLRLIDYLGHANPSISGLAFVELEKVAAAKSQSPEELFKPFQSSIAVSVVQDFQARPQKAQQLCDLLGININQWLMQTEQDTIPSLVLTKKKDILNRIAMAHGNGTTVQDICLQPRTNLAAILALLLAQPGQDVEDAAVACLADISQEFQGRDISDFVKIDSTLVACHLLRIIGDLPDNNKSRGYQAFHIFANIVERRPGQTKANSKSSRTVSDFFESNILGIMTHFSAVMETVQPPYPRSEKIRTLKAINEMVNLNKQRVATALPQIRAALQSAMEQPALCEVAFTAWLALLSVLQSEDIARIVDQSFALVLRHWYKLSPELQQTIHDRIGDLVKNHNQVIQANIMTLPSLRSIELLAKYGSEIDRLKSQESVESQCKAFANRLRHESKVVVVQTLHEVVPWLEEKQDFVHEAALSEQPVIVVCELLRALLDATSNCSEDSEEAAELCGKALGIIGCLDPNRLEVTRKKQRVMVLSNFDKAIEVIDWAISLLENVLVKSFRSVSNSRAQGFIAYVIQELLKFCEFSDGTILTRASQASSAQHKWQEMPEHVRITLTPFVKSRYIIASNQTLTAPNRTYPSFTADTGHSNWLRSLVYDLMWKAKGENAKMVFPLIARIVRGHDLSIANFMLPYCILNVVLGGTVTEFKGVSDEIQAVLGCQPTDTAEQECVKLCSQSVFDSLDYMSTWLQMKKKFVQETKSAAMRYGNSPSDFDEVHDLAQIDTIERFLASIPAEVIATQAASCGSYSRALFHWEQYIREDRPLIPSARPPKQHSDDEAVYDKLLNIYAQIDEPDGLEGISAHLPLLNEEQQAMQHVKAGRWTAAQAWYESQLADMPQTLDLEDKLLACLRETGRYAPLLRYVDSFVISRQSIEDADELSRTMLPSVVEAHWMTSDIDGMMTRLQSVNAECTSDFNVGVAKILRSAAEANQESLTTILRDVRKSVARSMTDARTSSIQASHEDLKKLHVLYEIEALSSDIILRAEDPTAALDRRLSVIGSYVSDKQYVLGIRRAVMTTCPDKFSDVDLGPSWLATAKLARHQGNTQQAYDAVLQANVYGDKIAKLEEARLLWSDGHQRHAIQALESSISAGLFEVPSADTSMRTDQSGISSNATSAGAQQNNLSARAHLLLAKWLDKSGQSQAKDMTEKYQFAARHFQRWEKGHYYLGKHYQRLLETERTLPKNKQSKEFQSGELTRLVIENQLRSVPFGNKYWHQTIPKILTLWLDLGLETLKMTRGEDQAIFERRVKSLQLCNKQLQKYFDRVPPYVFFSAIPQMISRITHPNPDVWKQLSNILLRIVSAHPSQALWSLLAVVKSSDKVRNERGTELLNRLKDPKSIRAKPDGSGVDLRVMISQAQKLSDGLLQACEAPVEARAVSASLSKDLGFNQKLTPCPLVVPLEHTLTPSLPVGINSDVIRKHKAFVQDKITIHSFSDYVLVLSSLQRPRKLTVRGSDGRQYGLLCKPKDDLRKDQRLMEFNGIINRALKRDSESSKRRLYIKTYAVTPLSEESGTIEWVEGIKPIRDILLNIYARKNIKPNYQDLRRVLDEASTSPDKAYLFTEKVLPGFPACLHEWFTETYAEPETWFAARLRYARSAAVMSMTGHMLGLGDRHGENILLEESSGGVFHVDFNCLFDKGLTFEKPELVPFRLTHNMVDAMGPYGYEGPFRKSCELTLKLLRQSKDTLMTVLETFLYDPTTDFVGKKKRSTHGVPETPQEILESVDNKLKGLLRGESVPLGVEGYVDALIREAVSPWSLASMYIGWCAFL